MLLASPPFVFKVEGLGLTASGLVPVVGFWVIWDAESGFGVWSTTVWQSLVRATGSWEVSLETLARTLPQRKRVSQTSAPTNSKLLKL